MTIKKRRNSLKRRNTLKSRNSLKLKKSKRRNTLKRRNSLKRRNTLKRRNSLKRRTTLKRRKMYGRGPRPPPKKDVHTALAQKPVQEALDRSLYRQEGALQTAPRTVLPISRPVMVGYGDEEEYSDVAFTMKLGPRGLRMGIWEWTKWPRAYNIYDVFGVTQGDVETLHANIDKAHDVLDTITYGIQKKAEPVIIFYKNVTGMILSQDPGKMEYLRKYTPETLRKYLLRTKDNMNDPLQ